nr:hypothetical protein [Paenibacillus sp. Marseille-P2973]
MGEQIKNKLGNFAQDTVGFFNKTKDAFTDLYGRFAAEIQKCYEKIAASVQQMVDWIVDNKDKLLNGLKKVGIAVLDTVQFALDILGLIPAIGEIADGLNALIYLLRKDYVNAGLSLAACIPFAGWAATGGKLWVKISKLVNKVDILKVVDRAKEMGSAAINLGQQAIAFITKKGNEVWSRIQIFDVAKKAEDLIAAVKKGHDQLQMKVHAVTEKLNIAFSEWWIRQSQMGIVPPSLSDIFNPKRGKVEGKGIEGTVEGGSTVSKTQAIEKEINDLDEKIANLKLEGNTAELKKLERERRKLANKLNTVDEISDSFVLSGGKEYERKIDNTKNFSHDKGDFGEEVAKIVARDSGLGDDISEMFQVGRNGIDAAFLSKGPPPKLTLIESKASASANFQYSDKQKLGGEAYFQDMLKSKDPRYGDFNRKLKQLKKENPGLIYDYIRVETDVKITRIGFGVDELKIRDWNKKIDGS